MKSNLTSTHSGKITFAVLLSVFMAAAVAASAQYKPIVTNDPSGDAGMMGIDVKNLSYQLSSDKKNVTFKFETYNAVSSWADGGFMIYVDDDNNPATGMTPSCNNKSMKADRSITCMNMMGMWMSQLTLSSAPSSGTDISSSVTITNPDSKTALVTIPLAKLDGDGDGKFNLLVGTAVAGSSTFYVDDLPNTGYSSMNVLNTSSTSVSNLTFGNTDINVYPNPAVNTINFSSKEQLIGSVTLFDLAGRVVLQQVVNSTTVSIALNNTAPGTYVYHVADAQGQLLKNGNLSVIR